MELCKLTGHSKRFEFKQGSRDKSAAKIDTPVHFPLTVNMLPYTTRGRSADIKETIELGRSCTYDLMSVVVHVGEIDTGMDELKSASKCTLRLTIARSLRVVLSCWRTG